MPKSADCAEAKALKRDLISLGCTKIRSLEIRPSNNSVMRPTMKRILCAVWTMFVESMYSSDTKPFFMSKYQRHHDGFKALEIRMSCKDIITAWNEEYAARFGLKTRMCQRTATRWYNDLVAIGLIDKEYEQKLDSDWRSDSDEQKKIWRRIGAHFKWRFFRISRALLEEVYGIVEPAVVKLKSFCPTDYLNRIKDSISGILDSVAHDLEKIPIYPQSRRISNSPL